MFFSAGTSCEPLKTGYRWAHEAHADEELLCMLRPAGIIRPCSPTVKASQDP